MKRLVSILAVFAFLGLAAYAKNLSFNLATPTKAGTETLAAGHYDCKIDGDTATLYGPHSKLITLKVKLEESGAKFTQPVLGFHTEDNGGARLVSIGVSGTTQRAVFMQ